MKRIDSQDAEDAELAKQVLSWISYAKRPLKVIELQHALATVPGKNDLDDDALINKELLLSVCAGIVTIENESSIIRLVHYSTQQYIEGRRHRLFPDAEITIALSCLRYLAFNIFDEPCSNTASLVDRLQKYKLSAYAVQYWGDHTRGHVEVESAVIRTFQFRGRRESMAQV